MPRNPDKLPDRKRVVVTGMGAVSPAGNTLEENWQNFQTADSFTSTTVIGREGYASIQLAGMVKKNFDPGIYAASRQYRRSDYYAHFGMAAGIQAMQDAGWLETELAPGPGVREAKYRLPERFN